MLLDKVLFVYNKFLKNYNLKIILAYNDNMLYNLDIQAMKDLANLELYKK